MRPNRLEIEGFASFRERTVVDFEGIDLFVLSGPMGAGKSSIIDAMGFALYGAIARFDNARLIAPVISQGLQQTRVRLDFSIGGDRYSVVRVVRRGRSGGAVNAEARLVRGEEALEGQANQVTERITELLGLNFEQFTKCVVLPQGDFADLLHARASDRQELLVRLLDIGFYRKVREMAHARHAGADGIARTLQNRLENELRNATAETYAAAEQRVAAFTALHCRFDAEEESFQELRRSADAARAEAKSAQDWLARLQAVRLPAGVSDLDQRLRGASARLEAVKEQQRLAADEVVALQQRRSGLPDRSVVDALVAAHEELVLCVGAVARDEQAVLEAAQAVSRAEDEAAAARKAAETAAEERERISRAHAAYHASRGLKAGDVCPVCGEKLSRLPSPTPPRDLERADLAFKKASALLQAAEQGVKKAQAEHARLALVLKNDIAHQETLRTRLQGQPSLEDCRLLAEEIHCVEEALDLVQTSQHSLGRDLARAEAALAEAAAEEKTAWSRFSAARDPLVALGAPPAGDNLEASWLALCDWAAAALEEQAAKLESSRRAESEALERERCLLQEQVRICAEAGVNVNGGRPRDAVIAARAAAEGELAYIDQRLAERESVGRELEECKQSLRVAGTLAQHLQANYFERWYLREALSRLTSAASQRLWELSKEQYTLALNPAGNDFVVIDHVNAGEERPVRTLSGGETFLASLSLALALGDEIADLAATGASRLEALFLDEGFGTLDPETLETVASAIEELGARGRMVGIVTHVPELAERIPVRFRISKQGGSSRVERLDGA